MSKNFFHPFFQEKITFLAWLWRCSDYYSTHNNFVEQIHTRIYMWQYFTMNIFRSKKLTKILPYLTARYTIFCTRWLRPPHDDCTVWVQWFSSIYTDKTLICNVRNNRMLLMTSELTSSFAGLAGKWKTCYISITYFLAHLSHWLMVSYCDCWIPWRWSFCVHFINSLSTSVLCW